MTELTVRSIDDERVSWCNLETHCGSQSGPNNAGIERSQGEWVCYLGHDDIWAPDHLAHIAETFARAPNSDFIVAGCIFYGCEGSDLEWITGLFDDPGAAHEHFFPPSSVAHRRDVIGRIGAWREPRATRAPVDSDFMLRAEEAQLRFVSTGAITAHKFAAGHRYLSYMRQTSAEQAAMLKRLAQPGRSWIEAIRARTIEGNRFMIMRHMDFSAFEPGALFEKNRSNKGLARPALRPLLEATVLSQSAEPRALDWYELDGRHRWSGPSRRPKLLLPFTGAEVEVSIEIGVGPSHPPVDRISVEIDGSLVAHEIRPCALGRHWVNYIKFNCTLSADSETVVTLVTPDMVRPCDISDYDDVRLVGLWVADVLLTPVECARGQDQALRARDRRSKLSQIFGFLRR